MNSAKLTIFYDGDCPLCKREVNFLESRNQRKYLNFTDINSSDFIANFNHKITYKQAMERIHALRSDGSLIKDIEVFQEAYELVGLGWIYAPTKLPIINKLIDFIYRLWAKYRLKITFRPPLEELCSRRVCNLK